MPLSFDQTVPRSLVHVRALAEILITDSERLGEDEFLLSTQLPRAHVLWADRLSGYHDPLVTVEVGRQAAFLVAHRYCDVPVSYPCLLHRVDLRVEDLEAFQDDGTSPPEGLIHARVFNRQERDGMLTSMGFEGELRFGDRIAVTMNGDMAIFKRDDYKILRAQTRARKDLDQDRPPADQKRVDPAIVGRRDERNVVIEDLGEGAYRLVVDPAHPGLFDHPHDHITGSLMLETYRQSAIATAYRQGLLPRPVAAVTRCRLSFAGLGELDANAECRATVHRKPDGRVTADLRLLQFGTTIAEAQLELTPT